MNRKAFHVALQIVVLGWMVALSPLQSNAQQHEIGFGIGTATYSGDIIRRIDPTQLGIQGTLFGRRNFDNAWSLRAGVHIARLNGADSIRPLDPMALARNAHFRGTLVEVSAVMEFHFLDYMAHNSVTPFSPYGFLGLGYSVFSGNGQSHQEDLAAGNYNTSSPVIPFGIGLKYKLKDRLILGLEAGVRASFTDNIDRIANEERYTPRFQEGPPPTDRVVNPYALNFGNPNDRDWYYFLGVSLSYSFHQVKCFN
ncbi:type IX secretion system protein PorG [Lunatimonas lonarensis]|uniref:type IX secretion system protein PorG n=1 Tax=Lunatimonas lonarensis TaxID=1232681 RepID=UPI00056C8EEB|nr:DUF6089 family protein [Lunatimonas lonarensis]